jgi:hypothetical protein
MKLLAAIAITLKPGAADDLAKLEKRQFMWGAWSTHQWPADVVRPGLRVYGFDTRARRLTVLLEVRRGGTFEYRTIAQLAKAIVNATGWHPDTDSAYWQTRPVPGKSQKSFAGVALRWKVVARADIPLDVRFPQLGWLRLGPE